MTTGRSPIAGEDVVELTSVDGMPRVVFGATSVDQIRGDLDADDDDGQRRGRS